MFEDTNDVSYTAVFTLYHKQRWRPMGFAARPGAIAFAFDTGQGNPAPTPRSRVGARWPRLGWSGWSNAIDLPDAQEFSIWQETLMHL